MSQFRAGIDELKIDCLQCRALSVSQQGLSQSDDALLSTDATSLDHNEIVANLTVEWEATHWCDCLVSDIILS